MQLSKKCFFGSGLRSGLKLVLDNIFVDKFNHVQLLGLAHHGLIRVYPDVGLGVHPQHKGYECLQFCIQGFILKCPGSFKIVLCFKKLDWRPESDK